METNTVSCVETCHRVARSEPHHNISHAVQKRQERIETVNRRHSDLLSGTFRQERAKRERNPQGGSVSPKRRKGLLSALLSTTTTALCASPSNVPVSTTPPLSLSALSGRDEPTADPPVLLLTRVQHSMCENSHGMECTLREEKVTQAKRKERGSLGRETEVEQERRSGRLSWRRKETVEEEASPNVEGTEERKESIAQEECEGVKGVTELFPLPSALPSVFSPPPSLLLQRDILPTASSSSSSPMLPRTFPFFSFSSDQALRKTCSSSSSSSRSSSSPRMIQLPCPSPLRNTPIPRHLHTDEDTSGPTRDLLSRSPSHSLPHSQESRTCSKKKTEEDEISWCAENDEIKAEHTVRVKVAEHVPNPFTPAAGTSPCSPPSPIFSLLRCDVSAAVCPTSLVISPSWTSATLLPTSTTTTQPLVFPLLTSSPCWAGEGGDRRSSSLWESGATRAPPPTPVEMWRTDVSLQPATPLSEKEEEEETNMAVSKKTALAKQDEEEHTHTKSDGGAYSIPWMAFSSSPFPYPSPLVDRDSVCDLSLLASSPSPVPLPPSSFSPAIPLQLCPSSTSSIPAHTLPLAPLPLSPTTGRGATNAVNEEAKDQGHAGVPHSVHSPVSPSVASSAERREKGSMSWPSLRSTPFAWDTSLPPSTVAGGLPASMTMKKTSYTLENGTKEDASWKEERKENPEGCVESPEGFTAVGEHSAPNVSPTKEVEMTSDKREEVWEEVEEERPSPSFLRSFSMTLLPSCGATDASLSSPILVPSAEVHAETESRHETEEEEEDKTKEPEVQPYACRPFFRPSQLRKRGRSESRCTEVTYDPLLLEEKKEEHRTMEREGPPPKTFPFSLPSTFPTISALHTSEMSAATWPVSSWSRISQPSHFLTSSSSQKRPSLEVGQEETSIKMCYRGSGSKEEEDPQDVGPGVGHQSPSPPDQSNPAVHPRCPRPSASSSSSLASSLLLSSPRGSSPSLTQEHFLHSTPLRPAITHTESRSEAPPSPASMSGFRLFPREGCTHLGFYAASTDGSEKEEDKMSRPTILPCDGDTPAVCGGNLTEVTLLSSSTAEGHDTPSMALPRAAGFVSLMSCETSFSRSLGPSNDAREHHHDDGTPAAALMTASSSLCTQKGNEQESPEHHLQEAFMEPTTHKKAVLPVETASLYRERLEETPLMAFSFEPFLSPPLLASDLRSNDRKAETFRLLPEMKPQKDLKEATHPSLVVDEALKMEDGSPSGSSLLLSSIRGAQEHERTDGNAPHPGEHKAWWEKKAMGEGKSKRAMEKGSTPSSSSQERTMSRSGDAFFSFTPSTVMEETHSDRRDEPTSVPCAKEENEAEEEMKEVYLPAAFFDTQEAIRRFSSSLPLRPLSFSSTSPLFSPVSISIREDHSTSERGESETDDDREGKSQTGEKKTLPPLSCCIQKPRKGITFLLEGEEEHDEKSRRAHDRPRTFSPPPPASEENEGDQEEADRLLSTCAAWPMMLSSPSRKSGLLLRVEWDSKDYNEEEEQQTRENLIEGAPHRKRWRSVEGEGTCLAVLPAGSANMKEEGCRTGEEVYETKKKTKREEEEKAHIEASLQKEREVFLHEEEEQNTQKGGGVPWDIRENVPYPNTTDDNKRGAPPAVRPSRKTDETPQKPQQENPSEADPHTTLLGKQDGDLRRCPASPPSRPLPCVRESTDLLALSIITSSTCLALPLSSYWASGENEDSKRDVLRIPSRSILTYPHEVVNHAPQEQGSPVNPAHPPPFTAALSSPIGVDEACQTSYSLILSLLPSSSPTSCPVAAMVEKTLEEPASMQGTSCYPPLTHLPTGSDHADGADDATPYPPHEDDHSMRRKEGDPGSVASPHSSPLKNVDVQEGDTSVDELCSTPIRTITPQEGRSSPYPFFVPPHARALPTEETLFDTAVTTAVDFISNDPPPPMHKKEDKEDRDHWNAHHEKTSEESKDKTEGSAQQEKNEAALDVVLEEKREASPVGIVLVEEKDDASSQDILAISPSRSIVFRLSSPSPSRHAGEPAPSASSPAPLFSCAGMHAVVFPRKAVVLSTEEVVEGEGAEDKGSSSQTLSRATSVSSGELFSPSFIMLPRSEKTLSDEEVEQNLEPVEGVAHGKAMMERPNSFTPAWESTWNMDGISKEDEDEIKEDGGNEDREEEETMDVQDAHDATLEEDEDEDEEKENATEEDGSCSPLPQHSFSYSSPGTHPNVDGQEKSSTTLSLPINAKAIPLAQRKAKKRRRCNNAVRTRVQGVAKKAKKKRGPKRT